MAMSNPLNSRASDDIVISLPKLTSFIPEHLLHCSKCGVRAIPRYINYISAMIGRGTLSAFVVRYCEGGLPPSAEDHSVVAHLTNRTEVRYICGGYNFEHLHVACKYCGHETLMRVKDGQQIDSCGETG